MPKSIPLFSIFLRFLVVQVVRGARLLLFHQWCRPLPVLCLSFFRRLVRHLQMVALEIRPSSLGRRRLIISMSRVVCRSGPAREGGFEYVCRCWTSVLLLELVTRLLGSASSCGILLGRKHFVFILQCTVMFREWALRWPSTIVFAQFWLLGIWLQLLVIWVLRLFHWWFAPRHGMLLRRYGTRTVILLRWYFPRACSARRMLFVLLCGRSARLWCPILTNLWRVSISLIGTLWPALRSLFSFVNCVDTRFLRAIQGNYGVLIMRHLRFERFGPE